MEKKFDLGPQPSEEDIERLKGMDTKEWEEWRKENETINKKKRNMERVIQEMKDQKVKILSDTLDSNSNKEQFLGMLEHKGFFILNRRNDSKKKKSTFEYARIPKGLIDEADENSISEEEIRELNSFAVSEFFDNSVIRIVPSSESPGKDSEIDVDLEAPRLFSIMKSFSDFEKVGTGIASEVYKTGSFAFGKVANKEIVTRSPKQVEEFKEAFEIFQDAVLDGNKIYGEENNPLIEMYYLYSTGGRQVKLMPYIEGAEEIKKILRNEAGPTYSSKDVAVIGRSILKGIELMHEHGVSHNDIHTQNILIVRNEKGEISGVKIIDPGVGYLKKDENLTDLRYFGETLCNLLTLRPVPTGYGEIENVIEGINERMSLMKNFSEADKKALQPLVKLVAKYFKNRNAIKEKKEEMMQEFKLVLEKILEEN